MINGHRFWIPIVKSYGDKNTFDEREKNNKKIINKCE